MTKVTPIGLVFPLSRGSHGYFQQSYNSDAQTRASLINLLSTIPGERPLNPRFGSKLYNYIFEQDIDEMLIQKVIEEDVAYWIPSMTIENIDINTTEGDVDTYSITITADYITNNVSGSVTIPIKF